MSRKYPPPPPGFEEVPPPPAGFAIVGTAPTKPDNSAILAKQALKYPAVEKFGVDPGRDRSAMEVAGDQVTRAREGILGLPAAVVHSAMAVGDAGLQLMRMGRGGSAGPAKNLIKGAVEGIYRPLDTLGRQGFEVAAQALPDSAEAAVRRVASVSPSYREAPTVESPETGEMANFGGANLAATVAAPGVAKASELTRMAATDVMTSIMKNTPRDRVNALATIAQPGIKVGAPQDVAIKAQPFLRRTMQRLGFDSESIAVKEGTRGGDVRGDLLRGASRENHAALAARLGKTVEQTRAVPIEIADAFVDDIHAPIKAAIGELTDVAVPTTARDIAASLRGKAGGTPDASQASALAKLAEKVDAAKTVGDLNTLKVYANREASKLFDKATPGATSEAMATSAWAYKELGDLIRNKLYPELEKMGVKGIREQGRIEVQAMDIRDGIYKSWATAAGKNAPAALQTWLQRFGRNIAQSTLSPRGAIASATGKVLTGQMPLAEWNSLFRKAVGGETGGSSADMVSVAKTADYVPQEVDQFASPSGARPGMANAQTPQERPLAVDYLGRNAKQVMEDMKRQARKK